MADQQETNTNVTQSSNPAASPVKPGSANPDADENNNVDPVDSILTRLTMGLPDDTTESTSNSGDKTTNSNGDTTTNNDPDADPRDNVVSQILKPFKHEPLNPDRNDESITAITEAMGNGDISALLQEIDKTTQAGINRTLKSVLGLIPDIIKKAAQVAGEEANSNFSDGSNWNNFVAANPDFKGVKLVKEKFLEAISTGADPEDAGNAVKILFGSLVAKNKNKTFTNDDDDTSDNGGEFSIEKYIG